MEITQSRRQKQSSLDFMLVLLLPLTTSKITTPKLYTSALSVRYPRIAYSGAMYPLEKSHNRTQDLHFQFTQSDFYLCVCKRKQRSMNEYSQSSRDTRAYMSVVLFIKLGESKIRYFRDQILVQEHIRGLDIAMDNFQSRFFVEISQTSCYADAYLVPYRPIQMQLMLFWACKYLVPHKSKRSTNAECVDEVKLCRKTHQITHEQGCCFPNTRRQEATGCFRCSIRRA